tara:strand:- start:605 stop:1450 length:846 start_codon:yes stop_codon:yes gene_type:complete
MSDIGVYEVGPRDGLQSAAINFSTDDKVEMIHLLQQAGLSKIEVGSFVHPQRVPNMADSDEVYQRVSELDCELGVLVPNQRGLDRAKVVGASKFNVFLSPSNTFNQRNLKLQLDDIFSSYKAMLYGIPKRDIRVYVSHAFGCPVEGRADLWDLHDILSQCAILGDNVVLCDTVGMAEVEDMKEVLSVTDNIRARWSIHLHHNYQKHEKILDNVQVAYDYGIREFDSSIGGLGGCPFSPGSGANLATEELIHWADKNNLDAGLSIEDLQQSLHFVKEKSERI